MVHIVSAPRDKGKTKYLTELAAGIVNDSKEVFGGILTLSSPEKHEYYAKNIETGEIRLLMSDDIVLQGPSIGRFFCSRETFDWASKCILESKRKCIVIDEVGRLELQGEGYSRALRTLLEMRKELYIAVRHEFVYDVVNEFGIKDFEVIEVPQWK